MTTSEPAEFILNDLADALHETGYHIISNALPLGLIEPLWRELQTLPETELKVAGIGRQDDFQLNRQIRRDRIHWFDGSSAPQADFLTWMEALRQGLNQRLFLGLFDYECHYASYAPGAFYKKHVDAFKDQRLVSQANRVLSTVLYLNPDWRPGDGGELLMYDTQDTRLLESIAPEYGKLVVFLSENFPHEVKPTANDRHSVAGWFRTQPHNPLF